MLTAFTCSDSFTTLLEICTHLAASIQQQRQVAEVDVTFADRGARADLLSRFGFDRKAGGDSPRPGQRPRHDSMGDDERDADDEASGDEDQRDREEGHARLLRKPSWAIQIGGPDANGLATEIAHMDSD